MQAFRLPESVYGQKMRFSSASSKRSPTLKYSLFDFSFSVSSPIMETADFKEMSRLPWVKGVGMGMKTSDLKEVRIKKMGVSIRRISGQGEM